MKRTSIRPISIAVIVLVVLGIVVIMQVQAMAEYVQHYRTTPADATSRGPEADPYLRHAPGGYDYELEPPPEEMP